jgi:hypothetical protein
MSGFLNTTAISGSYQAESYVGLKWCVNSRHPAALAPGPALAFAANLVESAAFHESAVVDGRVVAGSQPAGFVVCDLPPGPHEVAVANLPLSTNLFGHGSEKVSVDLRAGSTAYLSADPQMGIVTPGQITLVQVTENQGRSDVASLHQTKGVCGKA